MTDDVVVAILDEHGGEETACAGTTLQREFAAVANAASHRVRRFMFRRHCFLRGSSLTRIVFKCCYAFTELMADAGCTIYLRTPEGSAGGTIGVHAPTTHAVLLTGLTSPPLQEQGTAPPIAPPSPGSASYIPPPSPGVPASSPAGSTARALLQSPSHYELEDFGTLDALAASNGSDSNGPAVLASQLREYAEKLRRLKAEVRAWQAAADVRACRVYLLFLSHMHYLCAFAGRGGRTCPRSAREDLPGGAGLREGRGRDQSHRDDR